MLGTIVIALPPIGRRQLAPAAVRRRTRRRGCDAARRHDLVQHPLADRVHRLARLGRAAPDELRARHRRPLRRAGARRRLAAAGVDAARRGRAHRATRSRDRASPRPRGAGPVGSRGAPRHLRPASATLSAQCVPDAAMVATDGVVESCAARQGRRRDRPDRAEAAAIADAALVGARRRCSPRPTEAEFATSSRPRCASSAPTARATRRSSPAGPNARPAAPPSRRPPRSSRATPSSSTVGALVDGYHTDMTRTFVVGEPTPSSAELLRGRARRPGAGRRRGRAGRRGARASTRVCRDAIAGRRLRRLVHSTAPVTASACRSTKTRSARRSRTAT